MSQPIFCVSVRDRKDKFATQTIIKRTGGKLVAQKQPLNNASCAHIAKLAETYNRLADVKNLKKTATIVETFIVGISAHSSYVKGSNPERLLVEALKAGDHKAVLDLFAKIETIISSLPSTTANPAINKNYVKVFGPTYDSNQKCASLGLVDLNFDNFIIDASGSWNLFDYEWCFDFPVPTDLLMGRVLFWSLLRRYQNLVVMFANKYDLMEVAENLYVPAFVYEKYERIFLNLTNLILAEAHFNNYVLEVQSNVSDQMGIKPFDTPRKVAGSEIYDKFMASSPLDALDKLSVEAAKQYEEISHLMAVNQDLEQRLNEITHSKAFKYARKLQQTRGRIKGSR
ncbi:MAG TPA: hypothetical protein VFT49_03490 [Candidatus Saccharimonadales bacterium]|nr:hypothetical protein [Candidatus Saccharimonadales bacterium]